MFLHPGHGISFALLSDEGEEAGLEPPRDSSGLEPSPDLDSSGLGLESARLVHNTRKSP